MTTVLSAAAAAAVLLLASAAAAADPPLAQCLAARPLRDLQGQLLPPSALDLSQLSAPAACQPALCAPAPLTLHTEVDVSYAVVSVDERSAEGADCLAAVAESGSAYRRAGVPLLFLPAGHLRLVFAERGCSGGGAAREQLLLLAALRAHALHPLQTMLLCQPGLQATPPATAAAGTHLTLYSGPQARAAPAGFAPQYARLRLADDLVVSVLGSCEGGPDKMQLINRLGAARPGRMDSCLRLLCRATVEPLALGRYQYVVYTAQQRAHAAACFAALQRGDIGSAVATPLTEVRVLSTQDDSCTGTKVMVLSPGYAGSSAKLQRFLYYQAYKIHAFGCPAEAGPGPGAGAGAAACLRQRLRQTVLAVPAPGTDAQLPRQCARLLCDRRVSLTPAGSGQQDVSVSVSVHAAAALRTLHTACLRALGGTKSEDSVTAAALGFTLIFSPL